MKRFTIAIAATALSITPSLGAPVPGTSMVKTFPVTLAKDGLVIPGPRGQVPQNARFGMARAAVIKILSGPLGAPAKTGVHPDCGQGHAIGYARLRGGVELSFVGGKFVGWTLDEGGNRDFRTNSGIGIGTDVTTLRRLLPDVFIDPGNEEGGGLGPGFTSDKGVNGWLDGDKQTSKVTSLYAGETCIVA